MGSAKMDETIDKFIRAPWKFPMKKPGVLYLKIIGKRNLGWRIWFCREKNGGTAQWTSPLKTLLVNFLDLYLSFVSLIEGKNLYRLKFTGTQQFGVFFRWTKDQVTLLTFLLWYNSEVHLWKFFRNFLTVRFRWRDAGKDAVWTQLPKEHSFQKQSSLNLPLWSIVPRLQMPSFPPPIRRGLRLSHWAQTMARKHCRTP